MFVWVLKSSTITAFYLPPFWSVFLVATLKKAIVLVFVYEIQNFWVDRWSECEDLRLIWENLVKLAEVTDLSELQRQPLCYLSATGTQSTTTEAIILTLRQDLVPFHEIICEVYICCALTVITQVCLVFCGVFSPHHSHCSWMLSKFMLCWNM